MLRAAVRRCSTRPLLGSALRPMRFGGPPPAGWWPRLGDSIAARPTIVAPRPYRELPDHLVEEINIFDEALLAEGALAEGALDLEAHLGALRPRSTTRAHASRPRIRSHFSSTRNVTTLFESFARRADLALELEMPGSFRAPEGGVRAPEATPTPKGLRLMPKRTWQPNRLKRKRTHGFLKCAQPPGVSPLRPSAPHPLRR